jgi:ADP-heptose:LPS heptosyltransferase
MNKSEIKKILVISLTNIGDVILTFPVIDILRRDCPRAELSVVIGFKARSLLDGNPQIKNVFIFDKHQPGLQKLSWALKLRKERFDLVVDLRNTAIPFLLAPKYRTSLAAGSVSDRHMREKHLARLRTVFPFESPSAERYALLLEEDTPNLLGGIQSGEKFVVVAPGAADSAKRWPRERFVELCRRLQGRDLKIVLVGDQNDKKIAEEMTGELKQGVLNLCGRTDLRQLAGILKRCELAIVNDSGTMHLASYLDRPVVAIFGPSNPRLYGPWSRKSCFVQRGSDISTVNVEEVLEAVTGDLKI